MVLKRVSYNGKEIILVGTAHVSKKSRELVAATIEAQKPDVVGVELDAGRYDALRNEKKFQELNVAELIKTGQVWVFLLTLILKNFQRQIGARLHEKPGSEMLEAIDTASRNKVPVALLDRDVRITLKRAFHFLTLWEKVRFLADLVGGLFSPNRQEINEQTVEKLKEHDTLSALLQKLGRDFPTIKKVLIDERDLFIARKIRDLSGNKIVAVVGAGHVDGIASHIAQDYSIAEIITVPKERPGLHLITLVIPLLVLGLIGYAFLTQGVTAGLNTIILWTLVTGTLAAIGALLARAHPIAIAAAFASAPVTTLHPLLAAGWFSGLAQAKMSLPQVKDFEGLNNLNSYRDFEQNKVTRILLVVMYTNIGASIGTFIALPWIASLVF